jgi:glycosyltransferase involved in cell wall biosynthesis
MTTVSVIIPTFDRAPKVVRAVSAVLFQTFRDYEVIVVDDGSRDDTLDRLGRFHPFIRVLSHPENRGVSAARNTGIRASRSPMIAFLDSDDYWLPEKLGVQVAFLEENPEAVACQTEEIWVRKGRRVNPRKRHLKPSGDIFLPSLKLCLVSPSAVMVRASIFRETGLFDEDLPACEDYDLWLRLSSRYPIHLIQKHLVIKEGGHSDQLSARFSGMDRFRIKAMGKLLKGNTLDGDQRRAALEELASKCRIYGNGCLKRGKREEGEYYLHLPEKIKGDIIEQV